MSDRKQRRLYRGIRYARYKIIERVLNRTHRGIGIRYLAMAERTGDEAIVMLVLDHATHEGLSDREYPNQLIMALSEGFPISADLILSVMEECPAVEEPVLLAQMDGRGRTAAEVADAMDMPELAVRTRNLQARANAARK